jgi:hypothetical protein
MQRTLAGLELPAGTAAGADYWFRFHLVKGGIAALLLIVLVALGVVLWRTSLRANGSGRVAGPLSFCFTTFGVGHNDTQRPPACGGRWARSPVRRRC